MDDLGLKQMQEMSQAIHERYRDKWGEPTPEKGRELLLWLMVEVGEAGDIIKKQGDDAIVHNETVREHFAEELCDVLMYLNSVMLCYGITSEELRKVYLEKYKRNMGRW